MRREHGRLGSFSLDGLERRCEAPGYVDAHQREHDEDVGSNVSGEGRFPDDQSISGLSVQGPLKTIDFSSITCLQGSSSARDPAEFTIVNAGQAVNMLHKAVSFERTPEMLTRFGLSDVVVRESRVGWERVTTVMRTSGAVVTAFFAQTLQSARKTNSKAYLPVTLMVTCTGCPCHAIATPTMVLRRLHLEGSFHLVYGRVARPFLRSLRSSTRHTPPSFCSTRS